MELHEIQFRFDRESKNYFVFKQVDGINQLYIPKVQLSGTTGLTVLTITPIVK